MTGWEHSDSRLLTTHALSFSFPRERKAAETCWFESSSPCSFTQRGFWSWKLAKVQRWKQWPLQLSCMWEQCCVNGAEHQRHAVVLRVVPCFGGLYVSGVDMLDVLLVSVILLLCQIYYVGHFYTLFLSLFISCHCGFCNVRSRSIFNHFSWPKMQHLFYEYSTKDICGFK